MEKLSMLPTVAAPARSSQLRSLESTMQEALGDVARLRREVADLEEQVAYWRGQATRSTVDISGMPRRKPVTKAGLSAPDFDWDEWARDTKARIRGEEPRSA